MNINLSTVFITT